MGKTKKKKERQAKEKTARQHLRQKLARFAREKSSDSITTPEEVAELAIYVTGEMSDYWRAEKERVIRQEYKAIKERNQPMYRSALEQLKIIDQEIIWQQELARIYKDVDSSILDTK